MDASYGRGDVWLLYNIAWHYFGIAISVNLIIAYVIDLYLSVERLDGERAEVVKMMREHLF